MILIADSGTTKTDWGVVDGLDLTSRVKSPGMNPVMQTDEDMAAVFETDVMPSLPSATEIDRLYFYGAGCSGISSQRMEKILGSLFPKAHIEVSSDILGAARSLCGTQPGIACILGTGSNTCLYDGSKIVANVPPLGFILGDEGSGAVLGRLLISDVFKHQLPSWLCERFIERYNLDLPAVIEKVYRSPMPGRFLASVTPFLLEHIEEPAVHRLVLNNFKSFFIRNITSYPDYRNYRINVTGSVGWFFRDVLKEASEAMDCTLGIVTASPMDGLIEYHCRRG